MGRVRAVPAGAAATPLRVAADLGGERDEVGAVENGIAVDRHHLAASLRSGRGHRSCVNKHGRIRKAKRKSFLGRVAARVTLGQGWWGWRRR
jgi:hypothetical protein